MTAAAPTVPGVRPFGLARADFPKLRKRRGLFWTTTVLIVGPQVIAYGILAILHAANPGHHGPAGGIENLGHGLSVLVLVGSIGAIIAGASAGADDLSSGVFRELVVTGRSRLALFGARIPGGLAFVLLHVRRVRDLGRRLDDRERRASRAVVDALARVGALGLR